MCSSVVACCRKQIIYVEKTRLKNETPTKGLVNIRVMSTFVKINLNNKTFKNQVLKIHAIRARTHSLKIKECVQFPPLVLVRIYQ